MTSFALLNDEKLQTGTTFESVLVQIVCKNFKLNYLFFGLLFFVRTALQMGCD